MARKEHVTLKKDRIYKNQSCFVQFGQRQKRFFYMHLFLTFALILFLCILF